MATQRTNFTTPVGRLVAGSLYKGNDKDAEGKPLVTKTGPSAGQPRLDYFFALAIPKGGEQHWAQTEWGAKIWAAGHAFIAHAGQLPAFAWKVKDGDSQVPNKRGKKPCDMEGHPGHWILAFSSGFAPKIYNRDGTAPITEPGAVKLGYFVQVNGDVDGNGSTSQPGVYLNHNMVALSAYGPEIVVGPDVASAGFGAAALPAGAMATPPGGFTPPAPPAAVAPAYVPPARPSEAPAVYVPPVAPVAPVGLPPAVAPVPAAAPVTYAPNPQFLQVPGTPVPPAVPAVPAAIAVRRMSPAANGASYEQLIGAGWTDALLTQHGMFAA